MTVKWGASRLTPAVWSRMVSGPSYPAGVSSE